MENRILDRFPSEGFKGRKVMYTDVREVAPENVVEVVNNAYYVHIQHVREIDYLYDYYRGEQDIRHKAPTPRGANSQVVINRANEIVTFKTSYLLGEPIQYTSAIDNDSASEGIKTLNDYMRDEDKEGKDKELADWMHIAGVGVRMVLPDEDTSDPYASPIEIFTLDPREAGVIYYSGLGRKPLVGFIVQRDEDGQEYKCVYTDKFYCEIQGDELRNLAPTGLFPSGGRIRPHLLGRVPIIEYANNNARLGAFEVVLPLLNALNRLMSDKLDNVQDFVNAYDVFQNCEIDQDTYRQLSQGGQAIMVSSKVAGQEVRVYRIASELNQQATQTVADDLYGAILTICGMPNRNGGSSTSDTGSAVYFRDGFESAESRAKDTEKTWRKSEREFLRVVLNICPKLGLKIGDITPTFMRNNFSNVQSKAQVLCELLNNDKIDPKYAYRASGLFEDAEEAYNAGMKNFNEVQQQLEAQMNRAAANGADNYGGAKGGKRDGDGDGILNEE